MRAVEGQISKAPDRGQQATHRAQPPPITQGGGVEPSQHTGSRPNMHLRLQLPHTSSALCTQMMLQSVVIGSNNDNKHWSSCRTALHVSSRASLTRRNDEAISL